MSVQFNFAARSDVGLVRKNNQDAGYAGPHLLVLADGVGGYEGGDIASSVTISHLSQLDDVHRADDLLGLLRDAVNDAHDEIVARVEEEPKLAGMGTTCIALLRSGNKLAMIHIGDSRAYLLRKNQLVQVTKDHTLVQYLVDHGQITAEEAETHPKKNVILRALGDSEGEVELDESLREAISGDRWLLSSDGLFGVVSRETIAEVLVEYSNPDECAEKLVDLALAGGAPDNVTVVIADVVDDMSITSSNAPSTLPVIVGSAANDSLKPSRGTSGAAGAASRLTRPKQVPARTKKAPQRDPEPRKRRWPARLAVFLGLLGIAGGILFGTWTWSQNQYYVYQADGQVAIYQGIPQTIGPLSLSSEVERTELSVADLTQAAQQRLREPVTKGSLEESRDFVTALGDDHTAQGKQVKPETQRGSGGVTAPRGQADVPISDALENAYRQLLDMTGDGQ